MDSHQENRLPKPRRREWSRRAALPRLGGGLAAGVIAGAGLTAARAQTSEDTAAAESAVRQAIEAINAVLAGGDLSALDAVFATSYVNHTPHRRPADGASYPPDLAGLKSALSDLRTATRGPVIVVEEIIANGDTAAARLTFRGTAGATAADSSQVSDYPLTVSGVAVVRLRDGLVTESWDYDEFAELFGATFAASQPAEDQTVSTPEGGERIDIADVRAVAVEGIGTLRVIQGDTESLVIEAEPRALRRIEADVRDGVLTIRPARSLRTREPIVYTLNVIDLEAIELSGALEAEIDAFSTGQLRLSLSGSSTAAVNNLTVDALEASVAGNSTLSVTGAAGSQTVDLSGSSRYLAADLASEEATLTVSGAAQAAVQVNDRLEVQISGASSVVYSGDPEISQQISGVGSLTQAN